MFAMTSHFPLLSSDRLMKSTPSHLTSLRSIPVLLSALCLGLPNGLFPSDILAKTPHVFLFSYIPAICPTHLILLDVMTLIIFGGEGK
jgi:hypothetical protein